MSAPCRLGILNSHPIQYFAPLYRYLAGNPRLDLTVLYGSRQGVERYRDPGFEADVRWDVPLLDGYRHVFLRNWSPVPGADRPLGILNPGVISALARGRFDALWVHGYAYATHLLALLEARALGLPVLLRGETHLLLERRRGAVLGQDQGQEQGDDQGQGDDQEQGDDQGQGDDQRQDDGWTEGRPPRRERQLVRWIVRGSAACLAIGSRNAAYYRSLGVPEERIFLVPYVVDNHYFAMRTAALREQRAELRRELGLPPHACVLLFASKLVPRKRASDLLAAYARLRAEGADAALAFVGSGPTEARLRTAAADVPGVHFFGFRNQAELPGFFAAADIFCLPSIDEPWGLVINEAMAAGLPVVAAAEVGAAADLVRDGHNGATHRGRDVEGLTAALRPLVADGDLRARMGRASSTIISGWGFSEAEAGLLRALEAVAPRGA
ncbi:MAG: glycosyltransferase [Gemmatimonadota bacterium]